MVNAHTKRKQERKNIRNRVKRQRLDKLLLDSVDRVAFAFIGAIAAIVLTGAHSFTDLAFVFLGLVALTFVILLVRHWGNPSLSPDM